MSQLMTLLRLPFLLSPFSPVCESQQNFENTFESRRSRESRKRKQARKWGKDNKLIGEMKTTGKFPVSKTGEKLRGKRRIGWEGRTGRVGKGIQSRAANQRRRTFTELTLPLKTNTVHNQKEMLQFL